MLDRIKNVIKTDNFTVLLGNLSASALGLVTFMILARSLSKEDFGDWALFISASGLLDLMRTGLIRQALVRSMSIEDSVRKQNEIKASTLLLTIAVSMIIGIIVYTAGYTIQNHTLRSFFSYYPFLILASALNNFDTWVSHSTGEYRRMNQIRLFVNILFIAAVIYGFFIEQSVHFYFFAYISAHALVSLYSLSTCLKHLNIYQCNVAQMKELLNFGKHSIITLTGANLLKSSDSLLIGWFLGKEAVAIYAIPLKVLDLVEIPVRGFVMTAFRKLSAMYACGQIEAFRKTLLRNIKTLTILSSLAGLFMAAFPQLFVKILGGDLYSESNLLLQIFVIPMILLPLDKFIGISLDAINRPQINASKVWIMVIINVIGDLAVLHWVNGLWAVALVTVFNIVAGILFAIFRHPYVSPALFKKWHLAS